MGYSLHQDGLFCTSSARQAGCLLKQGFSESPPLFRKLAPTNPTLTLPRLGREPFRLTGFMSSAIRLLPQSGGGWEGVAW